MITKAKRAKRNLNKVRITAMRQTVYTDLMERFENPIEHACTIHEGQQWISIDGRCPQGLCPAAWETMRPFVESLARGKGNFYDGWMRNPMSAMISCNDGFRPMSFYIEALEDPEYAPYMDTINPQEPKLKRKRADEKWRIEQLVRIIGKQVLPRRQIIADLGIRQKSRRSLIDHYFGPARKQEYICFAYPNSPNKPEQAYKLTAKGLELLAKLKDEMKAE